MQFNQNLPKFKIQPAGILIFVVGSAAAAGGVGTALGDFFHGKKQAEELKNTVESSRQYETKYIGYKKQIENEITTLMDKGMTAEEAGISVLTGAKGVTSGVLITSRLSVGALDILEGAFQVSFPGN